MEPILLLATEGVDLIDVARLEPGVLRILRRLLGEGLAGVRFENILSSLM